MSSSDPMAPQAPPRPDYTLPIARTGEQQFGCIMRQRSGFDAGTIDMGARDITDLHVADQQDAVSAAYALYEAFRDQTGLRAPRDRSSA